MHNFAGQRAQRVRSVCSSADGVFIAKSGIILAKNAEEMQKVKG